MIEEKKFYKTLFVSTNQLKAAYTAALILYKFVANFLATVTLFVMDVHFFQIFLRN